MSHETGRVIGAAVVGIGAVVLALTYLAVRGDPSITSQFSRIALGGLGSLWLLAVGGAVLLGTDLLDEWRKLDRIEQAMGVDPAPVPSALRLPAIVAAVVAVAGLAVVVGAWAGASGASSARGALRALNIGVGGVVVTAVGIAVGVFWMARIVRLRQSRVLAPWIVADLQARLVARTEARAPAPAAPRDDAQVVMVGKPLRRYHAPGCRVLATGGPYKPMAIAKVPASTPPCGLCLPETGL